MFEQCVVRVDARDGPARCLVREGAIGDDDQCVPSLSRS